MMKTETTERGFQVIEFKDCNGNVCQLQQSSVMGSRKKPGASAIWLGVQSADPKILNQDAKRLGLPSDGNIGWTRYRIPQEVSLTTRMHLDVDCVRNLIDALTRWLRTGDFDSQTLKIDDAVLVETAAEHRIERVIAVTEEGKGVVKMYCGLLVESDKRPFRKVGVFRDQPHWWFWKKEIFIPNDSPIDEVITEYNRASLDAFIGRAIGLVLVIGLVALTVAVVMYGGSATPKVLE